LLVVAPPSVTLTGDGLQMAGQEQGMNIYERASVATGTTITINLSGTAPPPAAASAPDGAGAPGRAENVQGGDAPAIQSIPGRLDEYKWWLVGGFCVLFFFSAVLLWKKPVSVTVAGPEGFTEQPAAKPQSARAGVTESANASASTNGNSLAGLDRDTSNSLDALKDQLFRLELRRQAGTISDDEYLRERAKAERVLRDLVRG
jgi:hypothetical protein